MAHGGGNSKPMQHIWFIDQDGDGALSTTEAFGHENPYRDGFTTVATSTAS
jgi:hypothetical protein